VLLVISKGNTKLQLTQVSACDASSARKSNEGNWWICKQTYCNHGSWHAESKAAWRGKRVQDVQFKCSAVRIVDTGRYRLSLMFAGEMQAVTSWQKNWEC